MNGNASQQNIILTLPSDKFGMVFLSFALTVAYTTLPCLLPLRL